MERQTRPESAFEQHKVLIEDYSAARATGRSAVLHHCPVCGESSECHNIGDSFHGCRLCGSIWQDHPSKSI